MAHLIEIYIKKEVLETLNRTPEKGLSITIAVNDETNNYGQNVSGWVSQTKEKREAKAPKYYVGNGKVIWSNGEPPVVPQKEQAAPAPAPKKESDDLPF